MIFPLKFFCGIFSWFCKSQIMHLRVRNQLLMILVLRDWKKILKGIFKGPKFSRIQFSRPGKFFILESFLPLKIVGHTVSSFFSILLVDICDMYVYAVYCITCWFLGKNYAFRCTKNVLLVYVL